MTRRQVRREMISVHGGERTVKRDCATGRFLPTSTRANACGTAGTGPRRDPFERRPGERLNRACYRTKGEAMRAFVERNLGVIDEGGGLDQAATGGEFDAINARYDRRGRRRVTTMRQAIEVATDGQPGRHCLTDIDLETLNELPVCHGECVLPDEAYEEELRRRAEAEYRGLVDQGETGGLGGGEEVPF